VPSSDAAKKSNNGSRNSAPATNVEATTEHGKFLIFVKNGLYCAAAFAASGKQS
jgi:hypothetical protein